MTFFLRWPFWITVALGLIWVPVLIAPLLEPKSVDPAKCTVGATCDKLRH